MKKILLILLLTAGLNQQAHAVQRGIGMTINFPHLYNLHYENIAKQERVSWAFGGGYLPTINFQASGSTVGVGMMNFDVRGRWHPFAGGFFLGTGFGWQRVAGDATQTIDVAGQPVPTKVDVSTSNLYLAPHLGWIWTLGSFMFGLEAGAQFGLGQSTSVGVQITDPAYAALQAALTSDPDYVAFRNNVQEKVETFGKKVLPYAAVRLGFTFN